VGTALLLVEMGLSCVLAIALGYLLGRGRGVGGLGGITFVVNVLTFLAILPAMILLNSWGRPAVAILEVAVWAYVLAGAVGYYLSENEGSFIVEACAMVTALVCFYAAILFGALGLLISIALIGTIALLRLHQAPIIHTTSSRTGRNGRPMNKRTLPRACQATRSTNY